MDEELHRRLTDVEKLAHNLEITMTTHLATCEERGKRLEEASTAQTQTLKEIKEEIKVSREMDQPPKTVSEGIWRFIRAYGMAGFMAIALVVIVWKVLDRGDDKTFKDLEEIKKALNIEADGSP